MFFIISMIHPLRWSNVGPATASLAQHWTNAQPPFTHTFPAWQTRACPWLCALSRPSLRQHKWSRCPVWATGERTPRNQTSHHSCTLCYVCTPRRNCNLWSAGICDVDVILCYRRSAVGVVVDMWCGGCDRRLGEIEGWGLTGSPGQGHLG